MRRKSAFETGKRRNIAVRRNVNVAGVPAAHVRDYDITRDRGAAAGGVLTVTSRRSLARTLAIPRSGPPRDKNIFVRVASDRRRFWRLSSRASSEMVMIACNQSAAIDRGKNVRE